MKLGYVDGHDVVGKIVSGDAILSGSEAPHGHEVEEELGEVLTSQNLCSVSHLETTSKSKLILSSESK